MTILKSVSVRPSVPAVWLRSNLTLTDTSIAGTAPTTFLGVIPTGRTDISQPLNRISDVTVAARFGPGALLVAASCVLVAISIDPDLSAGFWLLALVALTMSYRTELLIKGAGGVEQGVDVSPLERAKIESFAASVRSKLAQS